MKSSTILVLGVLVIGGLYLAQGGANADPNFGHKAGGTFSDVAGERIYSDAKGRKWVRNFAAEATQPGHSAWSTFKLRADGSVEPGTYRTIYFPMSRNGYAISEQTIGAELDKA